MVTQNMLRMPGGILVFLEKKIQFVTPLDLTYLMPLTHRITYLSLNYLCLLFPVYFLKEAIRSVFHAMSLRVSYHFQTVHF